MSPIVAPIAKTSAALSPIILPIESKVEVKIPGNALGKTTLNVVWVLLAPKANEAYVKLYGITLIASFVVLTIVGRSIIAIVKAPEKIFPPVDPLIAFVNGIKMIAPAKPKIIDGIPLVTSINVLIPLVIGFFLA